MKKIETEILINAPASRVWSILTDFYQHPRWNPFIRLIKGSKVVGETMEVQIQPPGGGGMTFRPLLLKFDENREFRWKGKLLVKGIFDGEHYFLLDEIEPSVTRLTHGELFTGILVALVGGTLTKTAEGFRLMNEALKVECEKSAE